MIPAIALAAVFGFALPARAGCAQDTGTADADGQATLEQPADPANSADGLRVSYIDVGKGDCILIQAGESAALIDTGYEDTSDDVLSHLHKQGVDHLACLVITHYDKDHIGGVRAIGKEFAIDTVYLPGYEGSDKNYRALMGAIGDLGLNTQSVSGDLPLALGGATLTLLPSSVEYEPYAHGDEGNDNHCSLAASLVCGKDSYLFAGDLEKDGIAAFLDGGHGRFDVLKVPHHGEKSSLTDELLDSVKPQIAVITDSIDDPANKKTLKLLEEVGADVYRMSTDGTTIVASNGSGSYSVS